MSTINFAALEEDILKYWKTIRAFEGSLRVTKKYPKYTFYDGPPFATGLPHYGHILASVLKDVIPRYKSQTGHYVERKWGFDCHGVPIEFEIEKKLGIKTKSQIEEIGIKKYCQECRDIVLTYAPEWEKTIHRLGRWVDFKEGYKTMDLSYMESVWWVFKSLYIKGLVYQGNRVMPYSSSCTTPISNFESSQNYQTINDPSLFVKFRLKSDIMSENKNINGDEQLLIWTTTPWTLPSNLAICVHPEATYATISYQDQKLIVGKDCLEQLKLEECPILSEFKGADLLGLKYQPLFDIYAGKYPTAFRVLNNDFVGTEKGTGLVHMAPAFGVDDFKICLKNDIVNKEQQLPCPFDPNCQFTAEVESELPEAVGVNFRDSNKYIVRVLKSKGVVHKIETISHEYPFCWRSDTPLMYRAVPCWFININMIRENMLKNLDDTYWMPEFVKSNRFVNWIKGNGSETVDWCVSRNRYWGTPLPIWTNDEGEIVVIGSISELEEQAGLPEGSVKDLHRSSIDEIEIPSKRGGKPLRRIEEVFDCWFESGSMPYASVHYPFSLSTKRFTDTMFPADFIAEGLDQTRGWFYTLNILSTALFNKPAFNNVIVNGLILAKDGQKMSKRKKNYPPSEEVINEFGADAVRLYLTGSKAVQAEETRFSKHGIRIMVQNILIPLHNSLNLLISSTIDLSSGKKDGSPFKPISLTRRRSFNDPLDNWILQMLDELIINYHTDMSAYKLNRIVDYFTEFIGYLSRWYINLNKTRIKNQSRTALSVVYHCLYNLSLILAPFAPFYAEYLYRELALFDPLGVEKSVHWVQLPLRVWHNNPAFIRTVKQLFTVIEMTRTLRANNSISFKRPLNKITVINRDQKMLDEIAAVDKYLKECCNVLTVTYSTDIDKYSKIDVLPNFKTLGKKYGKHLKEIRLLLKEVPNEELLKLRDGEIETLDFALEEGVTVSLKIDDVKIRTKMDLPKTNIINNENFVVLIDTRSNADIEFKYQARRVVAFINKMRNNANLKPRDYILVYYRINNSLSDCTRQAEALNNALKLFKEQEKYLLPTLKYSVYECNRPIKSFYQEAISVFGISTVLMFAEINKLPPSHRSNKRPISEH